MTLKRELKIILFFVFRSFRISRRELLRGETLVSFGGYALSIAVLTASLTLLQSYQTTLKEGLLGVNAHLYFFNLRSEYLEPQQIRYLSDFLRERGEVEAFSAVKQTQVMAVSDSQMKGITARSIEWESEQLPTNYQDSIREGTGELTRQNEVVIGTQLANYLQVGLGDSIRLVSPVNIQYTVFGVKTGEVVVQVAGIYQSGVYETDSQTLFMNSEMMNSILVDPDFYNLIEVKLKPEFIDKANDYARLWNNQLQSEFLIHSWIDFNGNLFTMLVVQRWVIFIILSFLILIASFNILSNTTSTIYERKRELAILRSSGCSERLLRSYFFGRTMFLGLLSISLGIAFGLALALLLTKQSMVILQGDIYFIERFSFYADPVWLVNISIVSIGIAAFATLLSLRKISQLTIIEILRND